MAQNIDLGTFQWDTNKIEAQLAANTAQMQKYKAEMADLKTNLKAAEIASKMLSDRMEAERRTQEKLTEFVNKGQITQAEYNKQMAESNRKLAELTTEQNKATKSQMETNVQMNRAQEVTKDLRLQNNELNKLLSAGRTELSGQESAYRNLNKELNALKTEAKNLGAQMLVLEREGKKGTAEYNALERQFVTTAKKADELNDQFKELDKSVGDNQRSVGDYKDQIIGAFGELQKGINMIKQGDVRGGFDAISGSIRGVTSNFKEMALAFLSNPIGILTAALGGLALAFREVYQYNMNQLPKMQLIENAFGDLGEEADILRVKINGVEQTFGVAFDRILSTVDSISSSGLSTEVEAIDAIKKGLATAPDANEFLDKLDLAASKARQTGISLDEVLNLTKALQGTAIDPGAIYGGIEKASNRLQLGIKENTELVSAFGETFARDILTKVQSGEITTVQALEKIRVKGEEINITIGQQAELGKSLFGKLAANAGVYEEELRLIGMAYEDQFANLTDLEIITKELSEQNEELARAKDEALKSDSLLALKEEFNVFFKNIEIGFYNFIGWLRKADRAILGSSAYMRGLFKALPQAAGAAFSAILNAVGELLSGVKAGGSAFIKFIKGDFEGAKIEAEKFANSLPNVIKKIKSAGAEFENTLRNSARGERDNFQKEYDLRVAGLANVARQAEQTATALDKVDLDRGGKGGKEKKEKKVKDDTEKKLKEAARLALEAAKTEAESRAAIARNELSDYIATNAAKLEDDKRLNQARYNEQVSYYDRLLELQKANNNAELEKALVGKTEQEKLNIREEFRIKDIELETATNEKKRELNKQYVEQTKEDETLSRAIDFETRLIELEENAATEYEMRTEIANQQRENDLAALEEQRANNAISLENYEAQKLLIERQAALTSKEIAKDVDDFKLQSRADVLSGLADLFGRESGLGKIFAAAEITNDTVTNASKAFSQAAVFASNPLTAALAPNAYIQGGIIVAKGAAQIAKLVAPKTKGYATGGLIDGGFPVSRSNGDNRLITARDGEVILNESQQAALGGPGVFRAIGVPGFATGGVISKPANLSAVQNSIKVNSGAVILPDEAVAAIAKAVYAGSQQGLEDMSNNNRIGAGANL